MLPILSFPNTGHDLTPRAVSLLYVPAALKTEVFLVGCDCLMQARHREFESLILIFRHMAIRRYRSSLLHLHAMHEATYSRYRKPYCLAPRAYTSALVRSC